MYTWAIKEFKNKKSYLYLNDDIKKLVVVYIYNDEDVALKITNLYINHCVTKNKKENDKKEKNKNKGEYLGSMFQNNILLYKSLWLKYVSSKLPKYENFNDLRTKYRTAMEIYTKDLELLYGGQTSGKFIFLVDKKYDIIYEHVENLYFLFTSTLTSTVFRSNFDFDLFKKIKIVNQQFSKKNLLLWAISWRFSVNIIKFLIENGCRFDFYNDHKLIKKIYEHNKNHDIIKIFIENGLNINSINEKGKSLLEKTIISKKSDDNEIEILKFLIKNGADINITNKKGKNLIETIIKSKKPRKIDVKIVKILIKNGANINKINKDGDSLLILATKKRRMKIVKLLIDKGADTTLKNKYNHNALYIAKKDLKSCHYNDDTYDTIKHIIFHLTNLPDS